MRGDDRTRQTRDVHGTQSLSALKSAGIELVRPARKLWERRSAAPPATMSARDGAGSDTSPPVFSCAAHHNPRDCRCPISIVNAQIKSAGMSLPRSIPIVPFRRLQAIGGKRRIFAALGANLQTYGRGERRMAVRTRRGMVLSPPESRHRASAHMR
jgi:hypothetical protein